MLTLPKAALQACADFGIQEWCVCSGSRNSDLVYGLLDNADQLRLYPFFDERAAGFFALGRTLATERPVGVVTTSGTAVAELLPAVIEAYYQARPLVLLTADRPTSFRGSGAPQAIEQAGLFGPYAHYHEASTAADFQNRDWPCQSPVQVNVCLDEPRTRPDPIRLSVADERPHTEIPVEAWPKGFAPSLVVAGCLHPSECSRALIEFLHGLGVPILADATSGLTGVSQLADLLLEGGEKTVQDLHIKQVLRIGGVPCSRFWRTLETRPDIDVYSLSRRPFSGLARPSRLAPLPERFPTNVQAAAPEHWRTIDRAHRERLERLLKRFPKSEAAWVRFLSGILPTQSMLFLGNSLPIREWTLLAQGNALGQRVFANRGSNGIDGNLATFFGIAANPNDTNAAWGVFGDLTTLYDLSSPHILAHLPNTPVRIVVINNGGGKIFSMLPNFRGLSDNDTRIIENHHQFHFDAWAASWGIGYRLADGSPTLPELPESACVLEIRPDPLESAAFWEAWQQS